MGTVQQYQFIHKLGNNQGIDAMAVLKWHLQVVLRGGCQLASSPHPPSAGLLSSQSQRTPSQFGQNLEADLTFPAVSL